LHDILTTGASADATLHVVNIGRLPLYNADETDLPVPAAFRKRIADADALVIASPGLSGPLQNALDHLKGLAKPTMLLVNGAEVGAVTAAINRAGLVLCPATVGCHMLCPQVELTPAELEEGDSDSHFDSRGGVTAPSLKAKLSTTITGLAMWTRMLQTAPVKDDRPAAAPPPAARGGGSAFLAEL